ncbi:MAG: NYN domain-containing protein [Candidatus Aenigmarchaeota archaeon]|nr:NYN domain-containing protein [Candidatus Aenigmarchaeota archaeon]
MPEKSLVLIDAENVLRSWQNFCKINNLNERVDYVKLRDTVSKDTNLLRAYFYDGVPENIPLKKKNFLDSLRKSGIQPRTKVLKNRHYFCNKCGDSGLRAIQKGVDVSLATDILRHAWQGTCDICIVVSGDEDYKDAIDVVKDKGIKVWIVSFKSSLSKELSLSADKVILLDDIFHDIKRQF